MCAWGIGVWPGNAEERSVFLFLRLTFEGKLAELLPRTVESNERPTCGAPEFGLGHMFSRRAYAAIRPLTLFHFLQDDDLESFDIAFGFSEESDVALAGDLGEVEPVRAENGM